MGTSRKFGLNPKWFLFQIDRARPTMCRKKVSFQSAAGKEPERRAAEARGLTAAQMAQNDAPGIRTGAQLGDEGPAGIYKVDLDEDEFQRGAAEHTGAVPGISAQRNARVFHFTDENEKNDVLKKRERPPIVFPSRPVNIHSLCWLCIGGITVFNCSCIYFYTANSEHLPHMW